MRYKNFKIQIRSDNEIDEKEFYELTDKIQNIIKEFREYQESKNNNCLGEIYSVK